MNKPTTSQRTATANLHDRIRRANAKHGVKQTDAAKHKAAAAKLRAH